MSTRRTTAANLEERHQAGSEVLDYFDVKSAVRRNHKRERITLDLPGWMIQRLDVISGRNGVPRQSQIKLWLAEKLESGK